MGLIRSKHRNSGCWRGCLPERQREGSRPPVPDDSLLSGASPASNAAWWVSLVRPVLSYSDLRAQGRGRMIVQ